MGALANNPEKTPIAVVFSGSTSSTDKSYGWTHGYAMALTNATNGCQWGNNGIDETVLPNYNGDYDTFIINKDGYTESLAIKNAYSSTLQSAHPVFYYALNCKVTTPTNSSGWYLPSVGQWWDILINLGGMSTTVTLHEIGLLRWYINDPTGNNIKYSYVCSENINAYLSKVSEQGYNVDLFFKSNEVETYWTTTEFGSNNSYIIHFGVDNNLGEYYNAYEFQKNIECRCRPVIAF